MCTSLSKAWESMKPNPVGILNQLVNIIVINYCDRSVYNIIYALISILEIIIELS